jgi:hypothetical protein
MDERSKFIESHHFVEAHQHFSYGTVNPVYQNKAKVRLTYGWVCPFEGYKSNKRFKGILTPCMDGTLECLWIVEQVKLAQKKVVNAITQKNSRTH